MEKLYYDVVVIGAGPAGMAAALAASQQGASVLLVERHEEPGGILRQCIHTGFGLKRFKEELSGPEYAQRFINQIKESPVKTLMGSMVLEIVPGPDFRPDFREVVIMNPQGIQRVRAGAVVLAMGCRERTRGEIKIPGSRVAGVYTAGLAQRYINIDNIKPGKRAVILGSGDIGLIMARRLVLEGMEVEGVYELMPYANGLLRNIRNCLDDFGIPLHLSTTVTKIHGNGRLEYVEVSRVDENMQPIPGTERKIPCDMLLLAIGLIPENELSISAGVELNPATNGAQVDERLETSVPGIFSCGNVLHVHDLVDNVSEEATLAGTNAALFALKKLAERNTCTRTITPQAPIGYTMPARLATGDDASIFFRVRKPVENATLEVTDAQSGKILFQGKPRSYKPALMEKITLPKEALEQAGATLHLRLACN